MGGSLLPLAILDWQSSLGLWAGFSAGQLAERFDYPVAFVAVALTSLLALPLLARIGTSFPPRPAADA